MNNDVARRGAVLLVLLSFFGAWATETKSEQAGTNEVRRQLETYFAHIDQTAPTTFGLGLPGGVSPTGSLVSVDTLDADQLARLQSVMSREPGWQMAPEALAGSLPPELRARIAAVGEERAFEIEEAEALRRQVVLSARVVLLVGDDRLSSRGISAQEVRDVLSAFETLTPVDLVVSRAKLERAAQQMAKIESLIPASLRNWAAKAADASDAGDAEAIRRRLDRALASIASLPDAEQRGVRIESITRARESLAELSPQAVLALERSDELSNWSRLERVADVLSGASSLTPEEVERAKNDKQRLVEFLDSPAISALLPEDAAGVRDRVERADLAEIPLMRDVMSEVEGWENIPALLELASSADVQAEIAAIREGALTSEKKASLELFRNEMLVQASDLGASAAAVAQAWEEAPYEDLVFWNRAAEMTSSASMSAVVVDLVAGNGGTGRLPKDKGCGLSISCYVGKVKDALGKVFYAVIDPVSHQTDRVTNGIKSLGRDITDFASNFSSQLWTMMSEAWQSLASAVKKEFGPEGIADKLGLVEGFWNDIPNMPEIPCPPIGTNIPFFGEVGDADAALKYNTYLWIFDQFLDMLPDTSLSLKVKIPAHVIHSGVEFMGICMEKAAQAVADGETAEYENFVATGTTESLDRLTDLDEDAAALRGSLGELSVMVEESLAATRRLLTANAIEANLLASPGDRVASFMLPRSVNGYIETVREIIVETIDNSESAGRDVDDARRLLATGEELYSTGEYRLAYDAYRLAYRSALGALPVGVRAFSP